MSLAELLNTENNTIHASNGNSIINNFGYQHYWHIHPNDAVVELQHQLEIAELKNKESEKEVAYLKQMLELMDKKGNI